MAVMELKKSTLIQRMEGNNGRRRTRRLLSHGFQWLGVLMIGESLAARWRYTHSAIPYRTSNGLPTVHSLGSQLPEQKLAIGGQLSHKSL